MTCVPYRRRQSTAPKSGAPKSVRSAAAGQSLDIDGIHLHLTRKPIKNLYLRIKPPSGRVEISAPMRMSESRIADFVEERHSWILAQQQRMAEAQRRSIMALNEGAGFENGGRGVAGASGHDGGVAGRPKTGDISRPGIGDAGPGQAGRMSNRILTAPKSGPTNANDKRRPRSTPRCHSCWPSGGRSSAGSPRISRYGS